MTALNRTATTAALTAGLTAAVGVAFGLWFGRTRHALLKLRLSLSASKRLANVHVPVALLSQQSVDSGLSADAEGLVSCDVVIDGFGNISAIEPATGKSSVGAVDCGGAVLVSCFSDAHTHMVKTHAHPRTRNPTGSISDALAIELEDQPRWAACPCCRPLAFAAGGAANATADADESCVPCPKATDVLRRMDFALASAFHHGTRAVRTHVSRTGAQSPPLPFCIQRLHLTHTTAISRSLSISLLGGAAGWDLGARRQDARYSLRRLRRQPGQVGRQRAGRARGGQPLSASLGAAGAGGRARGGGTARSGSDASGGLRRILRSHRLLTPRLPDPPTLDRSLLSTAALRAYRHRRPSTTASSWAPTAATSTARP